MPKAEEFRLKDQMLLASRSVTANIAEGFGRHHHQENIQYCRQAKGSLVEMGDHLNVVLDEGYLSEKDLIPFREQQERTFVSLNGYIAYLKRCSVQSKK